ncbi:MAG: HlyD family efflux transporter periplasmic adaptor subunit [Proteobacteria bacterium]|nr:HlyD family efflux transporter periplasmic adaptor subunit [Pseudomonadota bacterium]
MSSLRQDSHRSSLTAGVLGLVLLLAWSAWAGLSEIDIHESSAAARLETLSPLHRVEAPIDGRVVEVFVKLGDEVEAGQPLVQLESELQRLALTESQARLRALQAQLGPLHVELEAAQERLGGEEQAGSGAIREAQARHRAAESQADIAEERSRTVERLVPAGGATRADRSVASSEAARTLSEAEAATHAIKRLRWESLVQAADGRSRVETIRREILRVEGEVELATVHVERLQSELDRREIVAPVAGRIAEISALSSGRYASVGTHLLSVLPGGELKVVAQFSPGQALGRLHSGQSGQMRLDGFPWTRFGTLDTRVMRVADESTEAGVRVELELTDADGFPAKLEHGLPGRVDIVVDRITPFELMLRGAGQWMDG